MRSWAFDKVLLGPLQLSTNSEVQSGIIRGSNGYAEVNGDYIYLVSSERKEMVAGNITGMFPSQFINLDGKEIYLKNYDIIMIVGDL